MELDDFALAKVRMRLMIRNPPEKGMLIGLGIERGKQLDEAGANFQR